MIFKNEVDKNRELELGLGSVGSKEILKILKKKELYDYIYVLTRKLACKKIDLQEDSGLGKDKTGSREAKLLYSQRKMVKSDTKAVTECIFKGFDSLL